ncbi:MAG: HipA domain-containing protein [Candidatus Marinimicrobia bacterium]|nr:HipA domain-containing protein [Candidatus Neomarinimicrobiota bacterium]
MKRCPITYESCGDRQYSRRGLQLFSRRLDRLNDFRYSAAEQRQEAVIRSAKMSIQGLRPKLSVRLNIVNSMFEIVDKGGRYILKPQHDTYPQLPENEDLTMRLAETVGIEVPLHGLIYCRDGSFSYIIKRFDREGKSGKLAVEDFAQLSGMDRETKYSFSMEKLIPILDFCTFPAIERVRLFRRCIFNYLVGNEDMHLKNFSLITRDGTTMLAPAYDFLSTTLAFMSIGKKVGDIEEIALPLKGKKRNLSRKLWVDYFGRMQLELNSAVITTELQQFSDAFDRWIAIIQSSFVSDEMKAIYRSLIEKHRQTLEI